LTHVGTLRVDLSRGNDLTPPNVTPPTLIESPLSQRQVSSRTSGALCVGISRPRQRGLAYCSDGVTFIAATLFASTYLGVVISHRLLWLRHRGAFGTPGVDTSPDRGGDITPPFLNFASPVAASSQLHRSCCTCCIRHLLPVVTRARLCFFDVATFIALSP
jgi:hypothetical protein